MNKFTLFLLLFFSFNLGAQEEESMRVERGNAVDRDRPIRNIFVDDQNNKWVGNTAGLYEVHSINHATEAGGAQLFSLLRYRSGNYNLTLPMSELDKHIYDLTGENEISAAHYDTKRKELWIGTTTTGLYQFKVEPQLQLIKQFTRDNSALNSDYVKNILIESNGRYWIGTEEGMVWGTLGKWKVKEKYVSMEGVAAYGGEVWVLGDEWLWKVNARNKWGEVDVDPERFKGLMVDIAVDSKGKVWIASEIITRFDPETGRVDPFAGPEEYTSQFASVISIDQDDALWVGTRDKGLFIIEKEDALTVTCLVDQPMSCDAFEPDGALKVTVIGGVPPYKYQWAGNQNGTNPKGLGPGEYMLTVTDSEGREKTASVSIEAPGLKLSMNVDQPESGVGTGDGKATVSVEGGKPTYRYRWDNGEELATASRLTEGEHRVTVVDQAGCEATASIDISQTIAPLDIAIQQTKNSDCAGDLIAALQVEVNGGKAPFQYTWNSERAKGDQPNQLRAGLYQVTVLDSSGKKSSASFEIKSPSPISAKIKINSAASTGNEDGKATAEAGGGTGPYQYLWDNGETTAKATKLGPGEHQLTVTDAKGCTAIASSSVKENILPLTVRIQEKSSVQCFGAATAALEVAVEGGKPPFEYTWNLGGMTGANPSGVAAGNYQVEVVDASGQKGKAKINVDAPKALTVQVALDKAASTGNEDGQASAKVKGGTGDYTYAWDNGEKTKKASKLGPGEHSLTVTDAAGCSAVANVGVSENILDLAAQLEQSAEIRCNGEATAGIKVSVRGGKGPYTYQWSDSQLSGDQATGLGAGTYEVQVSDVSGKSNSAKITIKQPDAVTASAKVTAPASTGNSDGEASIKANGGSGKYTYRWDNGETGEEASKLAPGDHTATITDTNGCTTEVKVTIKENILDLAVTVEQTTELKCNGEANAALKAAVSGGKGPFEYRWSDAGLSGEEVKNLKAGTYTITVSDASGKSSSTKFVVKAPAALTASARVLSAASTGNKDGKAKIDADGGSGKYTYRWDNGEIGQEAKKLAPGAHTAIISDANGCTTEISVTVKENILDLAVTLEAVATIRCNGEETASLKAAVSGGKAPFQYQWNEASLSGAEAKSLQAGTYALTVSDASGKQSSAKFVVKEPSPLLASAKVIAPANTGKSDGKAVVNASGGAENYTYRWDNGETNAEASKLSPGEHRVTATDANGCTVFTTVTITEDILPLSAEIQQTGSIKCNGEKTAGLSLTVNGGKAPYEYQWGNSAISGTQASNLGAGTYEVLVTDAAGQTTKAQLSVKEPEALTATLSMNTPASTRTSRDGVAAVTVKGGTGIYSIGWDNRVKGERNNKLSEGSHSVEIADENGCATSIAFETKRKILPALDIRNLKEGSIVRLEKLFFDADSASIKPASIPVLDELFDFLETNTSIVIEIGGHTNNIPPHEFCDRLSQSRAEAVMTYITQKGVENQRIVAKGYGKRKPKFSNKTRDGRRKNQRVEIKILRM